MSSLVPGPKVVRTRRAGPLEPVAILAAQLPAEYDGSMPRPPKATAKAKHSGAQSKTRRKCTTQEICIVPGPVPLGVLENSIVKRNHRAAQSICEYVEWQRQKDEEKASHLEGLSDHGTPVSAISYSTPSLGGSLRIRSWPWVGESGIVAGRLAEEVNRRPLSRRAGQRLGLDTRLGKPYDLILAGAGRGCSGTHTNGSDGPPGPPPRPPDEMRAV